MSRRRRRRARRPPPRPPSFLRRRSTLWLIAAIVTLAVGIVLGVIAGGSEDDGEAGVPTPTLAVELPELEFDQAQLEEGEVVGVIDGDTIDVRVGGERERIRYFGVDTPERGERCYRKASERNEALIGDTVLLLPDARERDRFDRLLRYAFTEDGDSVEARLIAEGLGVAWREDGAFRDDLVALEEAARAAGAGCMWGE